MEKPISPPRGRRRGRAKQTRTRLEEVRKAIGATQKQLADFLGCEQPAISIEETLGGGIGKDSFYKIADLVDVDPRILEGVKECPNLVSLIQENWTPEKQKIFANP